MEIRHQRVKPLLNRSLCLQNITNYKAFLVKRPKTILNLKLLKISNEFIPKFHEYDRKFQNKLYKALKLLKSVKKLNISGFSLRDSAISQAKLLSIFKRVSRAENISMKRLIDPFQLVEGYIEKWLRYLPQILHLNWGLNITGSKGDAERFINRGSHIRNPLKYLHYCPKIKSLKIDSSQTSDAFLKKAIKIKRYPPSLRKLDTKTPLSGEQLNVSQRNFQRLKSLGMIIDPNQSSIANTLSQMSDLREIDLRFLGFMALEIDTVFFNISQKKKLNKVKLDFNFEMPNFHETFQALKTCPITDFSIKTYFCINKAVLEAISDFIGDMELLENLQIALFNPFPFGETVPLKSICKQVSKLQKLRHLELSFKYSIDQPKALLVETDDLSLDHMKLETFSLHCAQINSSKPLSHLIDQLENSRSSLQKLTLYLENYVSDEENNQEIMDFIKKLENIRELKLPQVDISSIKSINRIAETVLSLKFLTSFQLGKISNEVLPGEFAKAFDRILCKKGLREFYCLVDQDFYRQMQRSSTLYMKKILRINPYLELVTWFGPSIPYLLPTQIWI